MEEAFEQMDAKSKQKLAKDAEPFGKSVQFIGWDGNNESNHRSIGLHLINRMNRFQRFKGRDLNSHMPKVQAYRAMTSTFEKMRPQLGLARPLAVDQIVELLKTR